MHRQAHEVLPALFAALGIEKPWLFGHSDGGSIALLYAARFPSGARVIVVAPHIFVEDITVASIAQARAGLPATDLRERLAATTPTPTRRSGAGTTSGSTRRSAPGTSRPSSPAIACPLLAVQGEDDEYGTLEQIHGIAGKRRKRALLVLPRCGHSPHRDQPEALMQRSGRFIISQPEHNARIEGDHHAN